MYICAYSMHIFDIFPPFEKKNNVGFFLGHH